MLKKPEGDFPVNTVDEPGNSSVNENFKPTASLEMLRLRSELLQAVRTFFLQQGFWEVETPILSHETIIDAHLEPCCVEWHGERLYLQTSPELGMKRLLAAGADAVFQITRAFRAGECGSRHNMEFTMLEWYRVGDSYREQMAFTEELVRFVGVQVAESCWFASAGQTWTAEDCRSFFSQPFERLSYDEAFKRYAGERVLGKQPEQLRELAERHNVSLPENWDEATVNDWLDLLLVELVEPHLGKDRPTLLYDYPAGQSMLATVSDSQPPVAQRFELYLKGLEICNGYNELTDAQELETRLRAQQAERRRAGRLVPPLPLRFLAAHQAGLPPCSGVALGIDRLLMATTGAEDIRQVTAFPFALA